MKELETSDTSNILKNIDILSYENKQQQHNTIIQHELYQIDDIQYKELHNIIGVLNKSQRQLSSSFMQDLQIITLTSTKMNKLKAKVISYNKLLLSNKKHWSKFNKLKLVPNAYNVSIAEIKRRHIFHQIFYNQVTLYQQKLKELITNENKSREYYIYQYHNESYLPYDLFPNMNRQVPNLDFTVPKFDQSLITLSTTINQQANDENADDDDLKQEQQQQIDDLGLQEQNEEEDVILQQDTDTIKVKEADTIKVKEADTIKVKEADTTKEDQTIQIKYLQAEIKRLEIMLNKNINQKNIDEIIQENQQLKTKLIECQNNNIDLEHKYDSIQQELQALTEKCNSNSENMGINLGMIFIEKEEKEKEIIKLKNQITIWKSLCKEKITFINPQIGDTLLFILLSTTTTNIIQYQAFQTDQDEQQQQQDIYLSNETIDMIQHKYKTIPKFIIAEMIEIKKDSNDSNILYASILEDFKALTTLMK